VLLQDETLSKVKDIVRENLEVNLSLDLLSKEIRTRRNFQHLSCLNPKEKSTKIVLDSLLSYAFQAETKCPLSGSLFLKMFCGFSVDPTLHRIPRDKKSVIKILKDRNYSNVVVDLLEEAMNLSSSNTRILLKKSSTSNSYVELSEGYNFDITSLLNLKNQESFNVKVACIDGYIESISEIHHLLSYLSESGRTCLLVSRGMSNDVLNTIKVNNDRKTLSVFPYRSPFDVESVNTLVDVAIASGNDVVSTTKGNLISTIKPEDLGELKSCTFSNLSVRAKSNFHTASIKNHVRNLRKTAEERPEISSLLYKRVRSLSSSCVDICIPDDINYYSRSSQIDEGIRIISSVMNNTYDPYETSKFFYRSFQDNFENSAKLLL